LVTWLGGFVWPLLRIGAVLAVAPVFGARSVPVRVRVVLALALTVLVVAVHGPGRLPDPLSVTGLLAIARELVIGMAIGFALQLVFAAVVVGGQMVANSIGLGFASIVDPQNGIQVPALSQFYLLLATLMFVASNGHLLLIDVLVRSFEVLPPGGAGIGAGGYWAVAAWGSHLFAGGVVVALPVVAAALVTNLAFGVVTRAAPQLNIFAVGFPVTLLVGFLAMLATLPHFLPRLGALVSSATDLVRSLHAGG
jgi:flagellar biosynthetic protein FliR